MTRWSNRSGGLVAAACILLIAAGAIGAFLDDDEGASPPAASHARIEPAAITALDSYPPHLNVEARLRRMDGDGILRQMAATVSLVGHRLNAKAVPDADRMQTVSFLFRASDPDNAREDEPIAQFDYSSSAVRAVASGGTIQSILGAARRSSARIPYGEEELREACAAGDPDLEGLPICLEVRN